MCRLFLECSSSLHIFLKGCTLQPFNCIDKWLWSRLAVPCHISNLGHKKTCVLLCGITHSWYCPPAPVHVRDAFFICPTVRKTGRARWCWQRRFADTGACIKELERGTHSSADYTDVLTDNFSFPGICVVGSLLSRAAPKLKLNFSIIFVRKFLHLIHFNARPCCDSDPQPLVNSWWQVTSLSDKWLWSTCLFKHFKHPGYCGLFCLCYLVFFLVSAVEIANRLLIGYLMQTKKIILLVSSFLSQTSLFLQSIFPVFFS